MVGISTSHRVDVVIEPLREEDVGELLTVQRAGFLRDAQLYVDAFSSVIEISAAPVRVPTSAP